MDFDGFQGPEVTDEYYPNELYSIPAGCYHRFIDSSDLADWLAGWHAGLLAGCWLLAGRMMRRRVSKEFSHARRSGEVGGAGCSAGELVACWAAGWAGWCVASWLAHGWLLAAGWEDDEEEGF